MIHKSAARNIALDYPEKKRQELMSQYAIDRAITNAAAIGKFSVTVYNDFHDNVGEVVQALKHYGYTVTFESNPKRGMVISWE